MPHNTHLKTILKKQVSEIYMFFDYDGHVPTASDETLRNLVSTFNDETEYGKLYISYPMVEALKHPCTTADFKSAVVTSEKKYKTVVNSQCVEKNEKYSDFNQYSSKQWKYLIDEHTEKNELPYGRAISITNQIFFARECIFDAATKTHYPR